MQFRFGWKVIVHNLKQYIQHWNGRSANEIRGERAGGEEGEPLIGVEKYRQENKTKS